jgi:hypothetical protein
MLKQWLIEYWWILATLLCVISLAVTVCVLNRRGTFGKTWPKITFVLTCLLILLIPTMHAPGSYVNAVIVVSNLWILFGDTFKSEKTSEPVDR